VKQRDKPTKTKWQASILLNEMKRKDKTALKKMMGVSDAVADLNYKRFQAFEKQEKKQAALAFDGPAVRNSTHAFSSATSHVLYTCRTLIINSLSLLLCTVQGLACTQVFIQATGVCPDTFAHPMWLVRSFASLRQRPTLSPGNGQQS